MKILNLCKGLLAVGTVASVLSGCNMEEHRREREERREERAMDREQNEMNRMERNAERNNAMRRQQAE